MGSGERPIGAAKGKQSDTEALCQPPPPPRTIVTVVRNNDIYIGNIVGPFLVHKLLGPRPDMSLVSGRATEFVRNQRCPMCHSGTPAAVAPTTQ